MTRVSTKGQVILPRAVRQRQDWGPGTRLAVEEMADGGVVLRRVPTFPGTRSQDVFGSLHYDGPPKSLDEMRAGIEAEAKRRRAGGRY